MPEDKPLADVESQLLFKVAAILDCPCFNIKNINFGELGEFSPK
jgi:hypothetical protein